MRELSPGNLGDLIAWLGKLDTQEFEYQLRKLQVIRQWALEQAGIDYEEGSRARIRDGFVVAEYHADGVYNGWWGYRECLTGGATGMVTKIDFSPHHKAWHACFRLDREWSVSRSPSGKVTRYWHGPAADTPGGYVRPSAYDQEHYPDGSMHTFMMRAEDLLRV